MGNDMSGPSGFGSNRPAAWSINFNDDHLERLPQILHNLELFKSLSPIRIGYEIINDRTPLIICSIYLPDDDAALCNVSQGAMKTACKLTPAVVKQRVLDCAEKLINTDEDPNVLEDPMWSVVRHALHPENMEALGMLLYCGVDVINYKSRQFNLSHIAAVFLDPNIDTLLTSEPNPIVAIDFVHGDTSFKSYDPPGWYHRDYHYILECASRELFQKIVFRFASAGLLSNREPEPLVITILENYNFRQREVLDCMYFVLLSPDAICVERCCNFLTVQFGNTFLLSHMEDLFHSFRFSLVTFGVKQQLADLYTKLRNCERVAGRLQVLPGVPSLVELTTNRVRKCIKHSFEVDRYCHHCLLAVRCLNIPRTLIDQICSNDT